MSKPAAGNYVIYSRILSPTGQKLAITYDGSGKKATVTPLADTPTENQTWKIQDYSDGNTQSLSPIKATNLQIGGSSNDVPEIHTIPAGGYVFLIRSSETGYSIKNGSGTTAWGVYGTADKTAIPYTKDEGGPAQRWVLQKV